jgi:hypothetical protein
MALDDLLADGQPAIQGFRDPAQVEQAWTLGVALPADAP